MAESWRDARFSSPMLSAGQIEFDECICLIAGVEKVGV